MTAAGSVCGSCGAEVSAAAKFCSECGAPVSTSMPAAEFKQVTVLFADVLRDVTVLAPVEPWSLGYELASPGFLESRASQTYRSRAISRPSYAPTYHAISSGAPRFVHKSVHNTLGTTARPESAHP